MFVCMLEGMGMGIYVKLQCVFDIFVWVIGIGANCGFNYYWSCYGWVLAEDFVVFVDFLCLFVIFGYNYIELFIEYCCPICCFILSLFDTILSVSFFLFSLLLLLWTLALALVLVNEREWDLLLWV